MENHNKKTPKDLEDATSQVTSNTADQGDQARDEKGNQEPKFQIMVAICCGIAFICYFGTYMRMPVVPIYASTIGMDISQIGFINFAFFVVAGVLSIPLGAMSDQWGSKRLAAAGLLILALTSFLLYFSTQFFHFFCVYALLGVGIAAFGPTMMSAVVNFSPSTHLGRVFGWYTTALYTAMSLGPAVGGYAARSLGFPPVFLISGIIVLVSFFMAVTLFPSPSSPENIAPGVKQTIPKMFQLLKNRQVLGCWSAVLGGCFGLGMFITFLPLHAENQGLGVSQIGLLFFYQGLFNALSRFPFGILSDRVSDRRILVMLGFAGFVASLVGFGFSSNYYHFIGCSILFGLSMGLSFTSVGALVAGAVSRAQRGLVMGGYNACIFFGMMMSSASMGVLIEKTSFRIGFFAAAVTGVFFAGLFFFLIRGDAPASS